MKNVSKLQGLVQLCRYMTDYRKHLIGCGFEIMLYSVHKTELYCVIAITVCCHISLQSVCNKLSKLLSHAIV